MYSFPGSWATTSFPWKRSLRKRNFCRKPLARVGAAFSITSPTPRFTAWLRMRESCERLSLKCSTAFLSPSALNMTPKIGIIGGSGLYQMPELRDIEEVKVDTPLAIRPMHSSSVHRATARRVSPPHGRGHASRPRKFLTGNIYGRHFWGWNVALGLSCRSLQEQYAPLDMVILISFSIARAPAPRNRLSSVRVSGSCGFAHPCALSWAMC